MAYCTPPSPALHCPASPCLVPPPAGYGYSGVSTPGVYIPLVIYTAPDNTTLGTLQTTTVRHCLFYVATPLLAAASPLLHPVPPS